MPKRVIGRCHRFIDIIKIGGAQVGDGLPRGGVQAGVGVSLPGAPYAADADIQEFGGCQGIHHAAPAVFTGGPANTDLKAPIDNMSTSTRQGPASNSANSSAAAMSSTRDTRTWRKLSDADSAA